MRSWGGQGASAGPILQEEGNFKQGEIVKGREGSDGCCHLDATRSTGGQRAV